MRITIPVSNTVEVLILEPYVRCEVSLLPLNPPQSLEAKIALDNLKARFNQIAYELSQKILDELKESK